MRHLPRWARLVVWRFWRELPDGDDWYALQRALDVAGAYGVRVSVSGTSGVDFNPGVHKITHTLDAGGF